MKKTQTITNELLTLRDFIRYGTSCFNEAGLSYGHGTDNAYDEAVYLVLETLHLPINQLEPYLDARLTESERKKLETGQKTICLLSVQNLALLFHRHLLTHMV